MTKDTKNRQKNNRKTHIFLNETPFKNGKLSDVKFLFLEEF